MKRFCRFLLPALLVSLASQSAQAQEMLTIKGERAGSAFEIQFPADVADLDFSNFELTSITLPEGLTNLKTLNLGNNDLLSLNLPDDLTNLEELDLGNNSLKIFSLPNGLTDLKEFELNGNRLHFLTLPNDLTNLKTLYLGGNRLNSLVLPKGLANLETLSIGNNHNLRSLTLPEGLRNLTYLNLASSRLESLTLPSGLANLETLNIYGGNLTSLILPEGLASLKTLDLILNYVPTPLETLFVREDLYQSIRANRVSIAGINLAKVTVYAPPILNISRMDGIMEITWNGGVLQSTTDLFGEWQDLESAESPLRILFPSEAMRFFRLRL